MIDVDRFAAGLHDYLARAFHPLVGRIKHVEDFEARIAAIEAKLQAIEQLGVSKYVGVWHEGELGEKGTFVTHAGGLWHCNQQTYERPGTGSAWTLAVKSGGVRRDA